MQINNLRCADRASRVSYVTTIVLTFLLFILIRTCHNAKSLTDDDDDGDGDDDDNNNNNTFIDVAITGERNVISTEKYRTFNA